MRGFLYNIKNVIYNYLYQILIFIVFIIIYLITIFPGAGGRLNFGDSIKWQYLYLVNGLPHGPGYPQFLILTEIFSRIIFFLDKPERITFISVFFGALSLSIFYSLIYLLTKNKIGSLISTIILAFSYNFWAESTEAEIYTLNIFYLLIIFYLFIKFNLTKRSKYYLWGCAVYAFSFGNHLSMITILPAILFISLVSDYKVVFKLKNIMLVALFVWGGILQYAFIFYRAYFGNSYYTEIHFKPNFNQFIDYITGAQFKSVMLAFTFDKVIFERFPILFKFLNDNFTILGLLFAFAGFFYYLYVERQHVILGFLSIAMLGQIFFNISYDVFDLSVFFIPVYVLTAIFIGLVFSAKKDLIPKVGLSVLMIYLFIYNFINSNINTKNTYGYIFFRPILSLYQEQKDNLPIYFRDNNDYYHRQFINYTNVTGEIYPKLILPHLDYINSDSFYVAANDLTFFPEIRDNYDIKVVVKESLKDFVNKHNKPDNVIFLSVKDEATANLPREFVDYFKAFGSKIETLPFRGSYAAVFHNGRLIEEINGAGPVSLNSKKLTNDPLQGKLTYEILSASNSFGNDSKIKINGFDYSVNIRGINLVVYNIRDNKMTEMLGYDTHIGAEIVLYKAFKKKRLINNYQIKEVTTEKLIDFIKKHNRPNNIIFFSAMDEASVNMSKEFKDYIKQYGSNIENLPYRGSYVAIFFNGELREAVNGAGPVSIKSDSLKDTPLNEKIKYEIFSAGQPFGNNSAIIINDLDYSIKLRGLNIAVYDTQLNKVTDIINYDTHLGEERKSVRALIK